MDPLTNQTAPLDAPDRNERDAGVPAAGAIGEASPIPSTEQTDELRRLRELLDREVTRHEASRDALTDQGEILEAFFQHTQTLLVLLDRHFNFVRVNAAYAQACQREVSEFPGHNHFEFYPSPAIEDFRRVVAEKAPWSIAARPFVFPDHPDWGTTYWDLALVPILNRRGEVEHLVFSLHDVTPIVRAENERAEASRNLNAALEAARTAEQARMASDLHDHVGGRLAALILELNAENERVPEGPAREALTSARESVRAVLDDLRRIVRGMHPLALEIDGLPGAVEQAAQEFQRVYGVATHVVMEGVDGTLAGQTAIGLYRIVQEALSNVGRHATAASVSVVVRRDARGSVRVVIEDDGRGFDTEAVSSDGFGLRSMRDRARLLGGNLTVESTPGKGTTVYATVPVPPATGWTTAGAKR